MRQNARQLCEAHDLGLSQSPDSGNGLATEHGIDAAGLPRLACLNPLIRGTVLRQQVFQVGTGPDDAVSIP